jgi:replication fork protection complex subunit Csm3/Swi3
MPSAAPPNARAGSVEPATNYDQDVDDFLRDLPLNNDDAAANSPPKDVDKEIKIRKARKPVAKLDEALLLGPNGVTKLRSNARKLKFKGKGHEFSDVGRMLSMYQLWLDDMYPRAKFRDGLKMVEKLGHSKRMQITRRGWMDATKPSRREEDVERIGDGELEMSGGLGGAADDMDLFGDVAGNEGADVPADDELDALMAENATSGSVARKQQTTRPMFEEDEDEMDAIIAEHENATSGSAGHHKSNIYAEINEDQDELNALMAEHESTAAQAQPKQTSKKPNGPFGEDAGPDEDELDALMAEESFKSTGLQQKTTHNVTQNDFQDEEEIMASMGW